MQTAYWDHLGSRSKAFPEGRLESSKASMETSLYKCVFYKSRDAFLNSGAVVDLTSTFVTSLQLSKFRLNTFRFLALADFARG